MKELKVLELFGGIGACTKALKRIGVNHKIVDYVEIDPYAVKSYNVINGTKFEPQDITQWDKDIEVDLIMHGSPCQDFSLAGKQAGGDEGSGTRSSLMYETIRIVKKLQPKYVIWENVKNVISKKHIHNFNNYINQMDEIGYKSYYQVLNAKDYGIPQNRERVFTISIRKDVNKDFVFPSKKKLNKRLQDVLENKVNDKYYLSDKMIKYISAQGTQNFRNSDCKINLDIARPITTDQNKRAGTTNYISHNLPDNFDLKVIREYGLYGNKQGGSIYNIEGLSPTLTTKSSLNWNVLIDEGLKIRKLTPRECWRLMGFDDKDFDKVKNINSDTQLYKQAGNSIVVNVLESIFKILLQDYLQPTPTLEDLLKGL